MSQGRKLNNAWCYRSSMEKNSGRHCRQIAWEETFFNLTKCYHLTLKISPLPWPSISYCLRSVCIAALWSLMTWDSTRRNSGWSWLPGENGRRRLWLGWPNYRADRRPSGVPQSTANETENFSPQRLTQEVQCCKEVTSYCAMAINSILIIDYVSGTFWLQDFHGMFLAAK